MTSVEISQPGTYTQKLQTERVINKSSFFEVRKEFEPCNSNTDNLRPRNGLQQQ
jgi:hypothetical protein